MERERAGFDQSGQPLQHEGIRQIGMKVQEWRELKRLPFGYFQIPRAIVEAKELGGMRATGFALLCAYKGVNHVSLMDARGMVKIMKRKENRCKAGVNTKVQILLEALEQSGYIEKTTYGIDGSGTAYRLDVDKIHREGYTSGYGDIYPDEMEKILYYSGEGEKKRYDPDNAFLLFAYLRVSIFLRLNDFCATDEAHIPTTLNDRRNENPECYYAYFEDIAETLGMSVSAVSDAAKALKKMGLIYFEEPDRKKINGHYVRVEKLFTNAYKRIGMYECASGETYYSSEIAARKKRLRIE